MKNDNNKQQPIYSDTDVMEFHKSFIDREDRYLAEIESKDSMIRELQDTLTKECQEKLLDDKLLNKTFNERINFKNRAELAEEKLEESQSRAGGIVGVTQQVLNRLRKQE